MSKKNDPSDPKLYSSVKEEAKKKFKVWPSAYASGWLVKEYKERFAEKHGKKKNPYTSDKSKKTNDLGRWYKEDWRNVCETDKDGNYKKCGRPKADTKDAKNYPYCRPLKRVSSKTPKTVGELSEKERKKMCQKKKTSMKNHRSKSPTRVKLN